MSCLRRTRAGKYSLADSVALEDLITAGEGVTKYLRPVDSLFEELPAIYLSSEWTIRCKNGGQIPVPGSLDGKYRVYSPEREFLMLGAVQGETLRTVKSFFEVK